MFGFAEATPVNIRNTVVESNFRRMLAIVHDRISVLAASL